MLRPEQPSDLPGRLSQIHTRWSLVFEAYQDQADQARRAQQALIQRYGGAIYHRADPGRCRFRDLLKTSLYQLVVDYQRRPRPVGFPENMPEPPTPPNQETLDKQFL